MHRLSNHPAAFLLSSNDHPSNIVQLNDRRPPTSSTGRPPTAYGMPVARPKQDVRPQQPEQQISKMGIRFVCSIPYLQDTTDRRIRGKKDLPELLPCSIDNDRPASTVLPLIHYSFSLPVRCHRSSEDQNVNNDVRFVKMFGIIRLPGFPADDQPQGRWHDFSTSVEVTAYMAYKDI